MYKTTLLLAILAGMAGLSAHSQEEKRPEDRDSYFDLSTYYLSNAIYFGRGDSTAVRYVHPAIGYHHKSGLSLEAGFSYQAGNQTEKKIDFYELEGRYEFTLAKSIGIEMYATKFFFAKNTQLQALPDLKAITGFQATADAGFLTVHAGTDYYVADENRIIGNAGISHEFETKQKRRGHWSFEPGIDAFAGTQYYYRLPPKSLTDTSAWEPLRAKGFSLLAFEFSAPVTYESNHLEFYFKPVYAIPFNPVNDDADFDLEILKKEHLTNSFFFEMGLHIKIK